MVGGITQVCSAIAENTASTPPAAPSRWPVIDLVELTMVLYAWSPSAALTAIVSARSPAGVEVPRSEEHTSELQSLMRISYAVFCLKKKRLQQQISTISMISPSSCILIFTD